VGFWASERDLGNYRPINIRNTPWGRFLQNRWDANKKLRGAQRNTRIPSGRSALDSASERIREQKGDWLAIGYSSSRPVIWPISGCPTKSCGCSFRMTAFPLFLRRRNDVEYKRLREGVKDSSVYVCQCLWLRLCGAVLVCACDIREDQLSSVACTPRHQTHLELLPKLRKTLKSTT
jgi:hypothetical protein